MEGSNYHISKSGDVMHIVAVDSRLYICKGVANQPPQAMP